MAEWKLRRGEQEWPVKDVAELQEWANAGRLVSSDYVYNPTLEKWMYASEVAEIAPSFQQQESSRLNQASFGVGCLGLLVCFLFWPAGVALIVVAVVMSAIYHIRR